MARIYTRTGDTGYTGWSHNVRLPKESQYIVVCGEVDELNSHIGLIIAHIGAGTLRSYLISIQHCLFELGSDMSVSGRHSIQAKHVAWLEQGIDYFETFLSPLTHFILPGGSPSAAFCHVARTVCRRAERALVLLSRDAMVDPIALAFLNRLSDFLFVVARVLNKQQGESDSLWSPGRPLFTTND